MEVEARRRGWFSDAAGTGEDCTEIGIKTCSAGSEYLWVPPASCTFLFEFSDVLNLVPGYLQVDKTYACTINST